MNKHTPTPEIDTWFDLKIEDALGGIRNYGYRVTVHALPGKEQMYYEHLRDCLHKIDETADTLRQHFRYRGMSKPLIGALHDWLPEPCWGVSAP